MVKLELLSPNLIVVLETILQNPNLVKYLSYDKMNPLAEPTVTDPKALMFKKVFPFPFNDFAATDDFSQVRAYFASVSFTDDVVETATLYFDVIVAKNLWLINTGQPKIRPYEIVSEIVNTFHGKSVATLGQMEFSSVRHLALNEKFDALQLVARVTSYSS